MSRVAMVLVIATILGSPQESPGDERIAQKHATSNVAGRVLSELGGKGVAGITVTLWHPRGPNPRTARTDAAGAYSFANVERFTGYYLVVEQRQNSRSGLWSDGIKFNIDEPLVRAPDLYLTHPQSLSGTVTDIDSGEPVPGAEINFSTIDQTRASITADSHGRYRLYLVSSTVNLYFGGTRDRYYPSVQLNSGETSLIEGHEEPETPQTVKVPPRQHTTLNLKVKSAPKFTGQIVLPDGSPGKGLDVLVSVRWTRLSSEWTSTYGTSGEHDADGTGRDFQLKTDDTGRFVGYLRRPWFRKWKEFVHLKVMARTADRSAGGVTFVKSYSIQREANPIKLTLAPTAGMRVRLLNPDGQPITNAKLTASDVQPGWHTSLGGPVTHLGNGVYSMTGLIPGLDYYLSLDAPGYVRSQSERFVLKSQETRDLRDLRLEWSGKKAIPRLLKGLQHADMYARESACRELAELGPDAAECVPAVIELLRKDQRNTVRYNAAAALGKIGPAAISATPHLIRALKEDTGGGIQREAATALGLIGDPASLPALREAAKNPERDIETAATASILRIEKKQAGNTSKLQRERRGHFIANPDPDPAAGVQPTLPK